MCNNIEVSQKDLHDLLEIFERKPYEATTCDEYDQSIASKCESLFRLDYSLIELENANGVLSPRYPARIFVPEYEHGHMGTTMTNLNANKLTNHNNGRDEIDDSGGGGGGGGGFVTNGIANGIHSFVTFAHPLQQHIGNSAQDQLQPHHHMTMQTALPAMPYFFKTQMQTLPPIGTIQQLQQQQQQHTIYEDLHDINKVRELITMAKYARCRRRFAVPVIMYRGKYICRSATISVMPETYGRKVVDFAYDCLNGTSNGIDAQRTDDTNDNNDPTDESLINQINEQSPFSYDEVIKSDIQLLSALNVTTIVDLMVEKRKIKYFMPVSSSEKADPERHYEDFNILSLPYPGCEFFKKFRDNNYMAKNLHYNWKQSFNDAIISVPKLGPANELDIAWYDYKKWDLVTITQNYLKATLKYIQEENAGLLIHCISGWDRTPLFISLVRLSLWADGLIHTSLNALQMAYLTLAYDWYLFGHQLPDRLKRGEDIMFFCFHVLKHITDDEFSIVEHRKRTKTSSSSGSSVIVIKSDCCDDPLKEDYILNFDQDSNESFSNCSNCDMSITDNFFTTTTIPTACSTNNIQTVQAAATTNTAINPLTSRSPNPKRSKTSPISVPGVSAAARQRQESTSSNGSWQVVTDTGSIDSVMNGSYMMRCITTPHQHTADNGSVQSYGSGGGGMNGGYHSNTPSNGSATSSNSNGALSSNGSGNTHGITKDTNGGSSGGGGNQHTTKTSLTLRKQRLNAVRAIFIQAYGKTIGLKFKEGSSMNLATFIGTLADQLF